MAAAVPGEMSLQETGCGGTVHGLGEASLRGTGGRRNGAADLCDLVATRGAVHLWAVELRPAANEADMLSEDELARARRFRFARDRDRFVSSRAALRMILAHYLGIRPRQLQFAYGRNGKPRLAHQSTAFPLHFNVSHSRELMLCALSTSDVGVDVEYLLPKAELNEVATEFFSSAEIRQLGALDSQDQLLGFYSCWTAKEAFVKACGDGLSMQLDRFAVPVRPSSTPTEITSADEGRKVGAAIGRWRVRHIWPRCDYLGAVVSEADELTVSLREFDV